MTKNTDTHFPDDWDLLLEGYLRQELSEQEEKRLAQLLEEHPAWGQEIRQALYEESLLADLGKGGGNVPNELDYLADLSEVYEKHLVRKMTRQKRTGRLFGYSRTFWVLTSSLLFLTLGTVLGIGLTMTQKPELPRQNALLVRKPTMPEVYAKQSARQPVSPSVSDTKSENLTRAVAVARLATEVRWNERSEYHPKSGEMVSPGRLCFDSGLLVVEFFSGALMIVEGPADVKILSNNRAFCAQGKIKADVPRQAIGFRIDAPRTNVVDLGTTFEMNVDAVETRVSVLDGKVELHDLSSGVELLEEGHAVAVDEGGNVRKFDHGQGIFQKSDLTPLTLDLLQEKERISQSNLFREQGERLDRDASLLVRFDFDHKNLNGRMVANTARLGRERIPNGVMVNCRLSDGRWQERSAIEFRQIADRFRFELPGEFKAMTFATWIRIDGLDRMFNSIFTTDGFSPGEIHWHLLWKYDMELGVFNDPNWKSHPVNTPQYIIEPEMIGRWIHLAATIDIEAGRAVMYLNGKRIHDETVEMNIPIQFKNAQLGNWTTRPGVEVHPIRHLSGAIDEFLIFDRALTPAEIMMLNRGEWYESE